MVIVANKNPSSKSSRLYNYTLREGYREHVENALLQLSSSASLLSKTAG